MLARISALGLISVLLLGWLFFVLRPHSSGGGPGEREIEVGISRSGMRPDEIPVREGDRVTLILTAVLPAEVHVHGYDLERRVRPGAATEISFVAVRTGRFPVEVHGTKAELGSLIVEPR